MAKKFYGMAGVSAKQEDAGGDMMSSSSSSQYNMPTEVKMKLYPSMDYLAYPEYADDYRMKDGQTNRMVKKARANSGEKY